jgi:hypothetical protein
MTSVLGATPRTAPAVEAKATVEELHELLRFAAQAGTYEIIGADMIIHPEIALRVAAMSAGPTSTYSYILEGDRLRMTHKAYRNVPLRTLKPWNSSGPNSWPKDRYFRRALKSASKGRFVIYAII